ncbi:MAG: cell division protein FtsZ [Saprospirales bacterium]|nr:cell division protein FtsZ [Saprospirales bacterium]MBK8920158.1 cell division protein FtsZ [Saprospirales bacterium]
MLFDLPKDEPSIIKIIGVGGGGSNAVTHMYKQGIIGVDYAICNTDAQAMHLSPVPTKIPLGASLTEGRGAGSKPDVGKRACMESLDEITRFLEDGTKMAFITAGMGGGTGTGAAPIIAKAAQELGILTVGIVTLPFLFEGRLRVSNGYDGLEELRKNVDCLVVISNDKLRQIHGNLSISQAFSQADNILCTAAKGIAEIITVPGYVNVDFEDVNTVMRGSGVAIMGTAAVEGDGRARRAVDEALNSPLLEDSNISGAKNILVNITSGINEATMDEIFEITEFVQQEAGEGANLIWGNCFDERLGERLSVTIIATGFEASRKSAPLSGMRSQTAPPERHFVHLDDEQKKMPPSLFSISSDEPAPVEEKAANAIEFDFDNVRETMERIRNAKGDPNDPFVRPDEAAEIGPEERRRRLEEAQRRREEVRNRPINVVKLNSPQTIIELENQPAYLRKGISLDALPDAEASGMSTWTISIEDEPEIKMSGNSFLHDNVD